MSAFEKPDREATRFWGEEPEPYNWRTRSSADERAISALHDELRALGPLHRRVLKAVALVDERRTWRDDGARDMPEWLAAQHGISKTEARLWLRAAHALDDLPHLSEALETGRLCLAKTVQLARFATADSERELICWARRVTLVTVRDRADAETRRDIEDVRAKQRARSVTWRIEDDWYFLEAGMPAQQGAAVAKALDRAARKIPISPEDAPEVAGRDRERFTLPQRRADALVALASAEIADDPDPDRATVVVHADLGALAGGAGACYIEGGPALHPEVAQLLACDARVELVRYDKSGDIAGIDPARRSPSPPVRRAVAHRDHHTCTFPGCEMRSYLRPHHIAWWHFLGSKTKPGNLVMLCPTHHDLVHIYGWRVELDKAGRAVWFRPDGTLYDPGGEPTERGPTEPVERDPAASGAAIF